MNSSQAMTLRYFPKSQTLSIPGFKDMRVPLNTQTKTLSLHLYLDKSLLDVYGSGGSVVATGVPKLTAASVGQEVQVYAAGGRAWIKDLTVYRLKPATFDQSRFH